MRRIEVVERDKPAIEPKTHSTEFMQLTGFWGGISLVMAYPEDQIDTERKADTALYTVS